MDAARILACFKVPMANRNFIMSSGNWSSDARSCGVPNSCARANWRMTSSGSGSFGGFGFGEIPIGGSTAAT